MKNYIIYLTLTIILYSFNHADAQVIASDDIVLCDGQQGQTEVTLTATSFAVDLTDSNIYTDDIFGSVINMGFDFVFYGNTYNQVVLASNNYLSFNTLNAGDYSDWTINAAIPTNLEPETQNAILCPWQDIYPGANGNGTIQYATTGEAPNRVFIASFCGIPMFSCTDICYSSQIKLYESTNIIETHIAQKVLCTTWNDGAAIHGLHNEDGTIAHVVTGLDGIIRNYPNQWTCENDGWRFTPNGNDDYIIESIEFAPAVAGTDIIWQDQFGNQIGVGGEITVIPGGNVTYTAGASLCGDAGDWCGFEGGIEGDDVNITFEELTFNGEESNTFCYQSNDGTIEVIAPNTGDWTFNLYDENMNQIQSEQSNQIFTFTSLSAGVYFVNMTELESECISNEILFEITEPNEVISSNTTNDALCFDGSDGSITIEINGGTPPYSTFIGNDINANIATQTGSSINFNNLNAGNYFYTIIDNNGCLVNGDEVFFLIEDAPELTVDLDENNGVSCDNAQDGFINISVNGGTPNYTYSWFNDDGFISNNEDISQIAGGTYTVNVVDGNFCETSLSVEIGENEAMSIETTIDECVNNNGTITVSAFGGQPDYLFELISENIIIQTNSNGIFNQVQSGDYVIIAYDALNCDVQESLIINSAPQADFILDEYEFSLANDPVLFTDLSNDDDIVSWYWNFGDGNSSNEQNPSHLYTEPGIYFATLTITDSFNCEDQITKEIRVLQDFYSYTPNIFTPNNDGTNDTFTPSLLNINTNTYTLTIFDRWGNKLFETSDYNQGWDGKQKNGLLLPSDVYSYKITYQTNLGIEKEEKGRIIMAK
jgi:gliding motility-associated-like protein